jgi:AcrR family transcriptional regulator
MECPKTNWKGDNVRKEVREMTPSVVDRRVQKTRKFLQEALIELVEEKGYDSITVREILDRADVGRSTFYAHFQDKDDLLNSILDRLDELFDRHREELLEAARLYELADHPNLMPGLSPVLGLFRFAGENHPFFKAMLGERGYSIFARPVYDRIFAHVHAMFTKPVHEDVLAHLHEPFKMLVSGEASDSVESEIAAHYFVSALTGVLVWWVEKDMPRTPEEIDHILRRLATHDLGNA